MRYGRRRAARRGRTIESYRNTTNCAGRMRDGRDNFLLQKASATRKIEIARRNLESHATKSKVHFHLTHTARGGRARRRFQKLSIRPATTATYGTHDDASYTHSIDTPRHVPRGELNSPGHAATGRNSAKTLVRDDRRSQDFTLGDRSVRNANTLKGIPTAGTEMATTPYYSCKPMAYGLW